MIKTRESPTYKIIGPRYGHLTIIVLFVVRPNYQTGLICVDYRFHTIMNYYTRNRKNTELLNYSKNISIIGHVLSLKSHINDTGK